MTLILAANSLLLPALSAAPTHESLASTQPAGLVQVGNPWLNPGFELMAPAELSSAAFPVPEGQATMVAPPTYMQAEAGADNKTPHSKSEIIADGSSGNALLVRFNASDSPRNLLIGQIFGADNGSFKWLGADAFTFEYKAEDALTDFHVNVHYTPEGGNSTWITKSSGPIAATDEWTTISFDVSGIPDDAPITMATIRIRGDVHTNVTFDNIRITGSTFTPVDTHRDPTDGYAMILESDAMGPGFVLEPVMTGLGEKFVVKSQLRDFTGITPRNVTAAETAYEIFSIVGSSYLDNNWSTRGFERDVNGLVSVDGETILFAVDKDATLAQSDDGLAAMYAYWNISQVREVDGRLVYSGEGYFSAMKNALRDYSLADQLDYAITPVVLTNASTTTLAEPSSLALSFPDGDDENASESFTVRVQVPATGFTETATLTVAGHPDRTITLDGVTTEYHEVFTGPAPTDGDIAFSGSLLVFPSVVNLEAPSADVIACQSDAACEEDVTEVASLTEVAFRANATDAQDENLTYQWNFADGTGAEGPSVTHVFTRPGSYRVTLNVTDSDGNLAQAFHEITVTNRAPSTEIAVPLIVTRLADLEVPVTGTDADGVVERLRVAVDGDVVTTAHADTTTITIPKSALTLGAHVIRVRAWDDHGLNAVDEQTFTVQNIAPTASLVASDLLVGKGGNVTFTAFGSDADSPNLTLKLAFGDGSEKDVVDGEEVTHAFATAGTFTAVLTANDTEGGIVNASTTITVDGTAPVTTASVEDGAWHTGNVSVELTAVDDHTTTTTFVKTGDGNFTAYEGAFEVGGDGTHTVTFYSVDAFGNAEDAQSVTVKIDSGLPTINMTEMPENYEVVTGNHTLFASAEDDGSGVASVRILIDGEECGAGETEAECAWDTHAHAFGFFELTVEARDVAGHVATESVTVLVMNGLVMPLGASVPALL